MQKKQVLILGAGISGLSAAWYLNRSGLPVEITILEKQTRAGGWMHTDHSLGFHFEKGPRTFKTNKCPATIQLIAELGMQNELIWSMAKPHHRYLWYASELHRFPTNPISFLFSPITQGFVKALLTEWKKPTKCGDETVWEFVMRRFNYDVARLFFDPMVVGIFGGDIRKISMRSCFPILKSWEETYGSVTKGFFHSYQEKKKQSKFAKEIPELPLSSIFSFRAGIEQLPQTLVNRTPATIHYQQEVNAISFEGEKVHVQTDKGTFTADHLFCALPVKQTGQLLGTHMPDAARELTQMPSESLAVVNCGYEQNVLPVQGFGYLTPTHAHEEILGVVFDSSIFPEHNRRPHETRLTIKLEDKGKSQEVQVEAALKGIRRHLGVSSLPKEISYKRAIAAIPQYGVGHLEKMQEFLQLAQKELPRCHFLGNYLIGVSVDQCIQRSKQAVNELLSSNLF